MTTSSLRTIVAILYPGFAPFDLAGPVQAFGAAGGGYSQILLSARGGAVESDCLGFAVQTLPFSAAPSRIDTLLVPGGAGAPEARWDTDLIDAIRTFGGAARRVASVCVGAYLLAEAGFLDGRRAATHWRACAHFQAKYPGVILDPDAIYVRDGHIWTSAGISAGVDLALAMIEEDQGRARAMEVARELVVYLRRSGGQSQFSTVLAAQSGARNRFGDLMVWMRENLGEPLPVATLAARAGMSERSFARRFQQTTGLTPAKAVEAMRVEAARGLLEDGAALAQAASGAGFEDEQRMRRAFVRHLKVTPPEWRDRFRTAGPGESAKT
jgi:transcriptional regulator GlxA family with amidase domain